ncbi:MAG: hypothetical protein ACT4OO_16230 [Nitrospiraceae bacterium]
MPDLFDKDLVVFAGTLAAFLAAILSIMDKMISLQDRLFAGKQRKPATAVDRPPTESAAARRETVSTKLLHKASYLFVYETSVIVAAGVLLNYLGLTLSRHLQSILFLDMTGTALAAFLLGPWWGAIVALLSNSVVNWLLFPETGADVVIFPWSLVNMTGGFFWGYMARRAGFSKYLRAGRSSAFSHVWFLLSFGALGAVVMSVPGTLVQAALGEQAMFALNPAVASTLRTVVDQWQLAVQAHLDAVFGLAWSEDVGWAFVNWLQNCIRYIPDKTMSAAIALVVLKYGYPLFERELIHDDQDGNRVGDERVLPLVLGLLYAPSFGALVTADTYGGMQFWPLWTVPWIMVVGGHVALRRWGPAESGLREARLQRAERYARAMKPIEREPSHEFCRRLTLVTMIASLLFALCLPILLPDFYRVTFNFFCVVYGFLLAVHLVRVAIAQNLSVSRADE